MRTITELLKDKNMHELSRRMTNAGYPITYPTLIYWRQGKTSPRLDRLMLAEKVVRESDPEVADFIGELISAIR